MKQKLSLSAFRSSLVVGAALLLTVSGCVGYVRGPRDEVYVQPSGPVGGVFMDQDDYIYYPQYGIYFGRGSHRYYRHEGRAWVATPEPRGVSAQVLIAAPSVRVDFHDSPAVHHAQVVKSYPKNWRPAGGNAGRPEGRPDNRRPNDNR